MPAMRLVRHRPNGASLRQSGHVSQVELATIGVPAAPKLKLTRHTLTRRVSVETITAAPVSVRTRCYLPVLNAGRGDGVALLRSS